MAQEIPLGLYFKDIAGEYSLQATPDYGTQSERTKISNYDQLYSSALKKLDYYKQQQQLGTDRQYGADWIKKFSTDPYTQSGGDELYQKLVSKTATPEEILKVFYGNETGTPIAQSTLQTLRGLQGGTSVASDYVIDPNTGNMTLKSSLEEQAKNQAAVAAGTMKNIGTAEKPLYVPTGSAADLQAQGKTIGEQLATPSVQAQIKQQGLTPSVPIKPQTLGAMGGSGTKVEVQGFPSSSDEYDQWIAQGRTFDASTGKWYESGGTTGGVTGGVTTGNITTGQDTTQQQSVSDFSSVYKKALTESGASDIKTKYESVIKEQTSLTNEMNDKIADIDENPWMSESVKNREKNRLQSRYESRLTTLTNEQKLFDSLYQQAVSEAKYLATGEVEQQQFMLQYIQDAEDAVAKLQQQAIDNKDKALKTVNGGLYDTNTNSWIVQPKSSTEGLTTAQINSTINSIANSFDNEPIVKEFNTINSYVNTFKNLGTSATDDQARIYAFAKVMDPNSVVRESEYKTVQDYSQALLKAYGVNLARIFTDVGALTPEARASMQKTLDTKLNSQKAVYSNLYNEYQRRLSNVQSGGFNTITDYSKSGVSDDLSNQIQELRDQGYSEDQINQLINQ